MKKIPCCNLFTAKNYLDSTTKCNISCTSTWDARYKIPIRRGHSLHSLRTPICRLLREYTKSSSRFYETSSKQRTTIMRPLTGRKRCFAEYEVTKNGCRPNPEPTRSIRDFCRPSSITYLCSVCGLGQQVGHFSVQIAKTLGSLFSLQLLKIYISWNW